MISINRLKYYSALLQKKSRDEENKFIAEGFKVVKEGLQSNFKCEIIFIRKDIEEREPSLFNELTKSDIEMEILNEKEFDRISDSKTPQGITAVFQKKINKKTIIAKSAVCFDNISDPGNVGTIIRNCDWFGIKDIIIGKNNVDIFNPKVIRSSMGSIFHQQFLFTENLELELSFLKEKGFRIITADMKGTNLYQFTFPEKSLIVFSNEARGVSKGLKHLSDDIITIPGSGKAESLNVASASAVILSRYAEKVL